MGIVSEGPEGPGKSLLRGVETTDKGVVETTGEGIVSEGLKGHGKSLLRVVETIGGSVVSSENCTGSVGSTEEKCGNKDGISCPFSLCDGAGTSE